MTDYVYDAHGVAVGYIRGRFVHILSGTAVGQVQGTHVHKLTGMYVGELHEGMIVNKHIPKPANLGHPGNPGNPGSSGTPARRAAVRHNFPDVFPELLR